MRIVLAVGTASNLILTLGVTDTGFSVHKIFIANVEAVILLVDFVALTSSTAAHRLFKNPDIDIAYSLITITCHLSPHYINGNLKQRYNT